MSKVMVSFIASSQAGDACEMVLVEGPWHGDVESHLRGLQDRMFRCLDAALDGKLAENFPEAKGKAVVVRLDCYDVPRNDVEAFFRRFVEGVGTLPDYSTAASQFVAEFRFEINFDTIA